MLAVDGRGRFQAGFGSGIGMSLASFLRFWAVAAGVKPNSAAIRIMSSACLLAMAT
jgi:hypothetical protein